MPNTNTAPFSYAEAACQAPGGAMAQDSRAVVLGEDLGMHGAARAAQARTEDDEVVN